MLWGMLTALFPMPTFSGWRQKASRGEPAPRGGPAPRGEPAPRGAPAARGTAAGGLGDGVGDGVGNLGVPRRASDRPDPPATARRPTYGAPPAGRGFRAGLLGTTAAAATTAGWPAEKLWEGPWKS